MPELPARNLTLLVALPELGSPELARLYRAITDDDDLDEAEGLLPVLLERVDTRRRARLAGAVATLHAAERLPPMLASAALIDLDSRSDLLIGASLI